MKHHVNGIVTNASAVNDIAETLGYDKMMINRTLKGIFSFKGLKQLIAKGTQVKIKNLGTFKPNRKLKIVNKRKQRAKRTTERIKKNNYLKTKKQKMKARGTTGVERTPIPMGMHKATIINVMDLGTQKSGVPTFPDRRKILIGLELKEEKDYKVFAPGEEAKPSVTSVTESVGVDADGYFKINWEKSNLGKFITEFMGDALTEEMKKDFDFKVLLAKNGQVLIKHKAGKKDPTVKYDFVDSALHKEENAVYNPTYNPFILFSIDGDCLFNDKKNNKKVTGTAKEVLPLLHPWQIKKITSSPEWKAKYGNFGADLAVKKSAEASLEDDYSEETIDTGEESPF